MAKSKESVNNLDPAAEAAGFVANATEPDATEALPKRRGRPVGSKNRTKKETISKEGRNQKAFAALINRPIFTLLDIVGGGDATPTKPEQDELNAALCEYLETKELKYLPPGLVLISLYAEIIGQKFAKPTVREKFRATVITLAGRIQKYRERKQRMKQNAPIATKGNSRTSRGDGDLPRAETFEQNDLDPAVVTVGSAH